MNNAPLYTKDYLIMSFQVDANGHAPLTTIGNLFQDATARHASELNLDIYKLIGNGHTWVLTRMLIEVNSFPRWNDTIRIETWVSKNEQFFSYRDIVAKDQVGNTTIRAVTSWAIIDIINRKPIPIDFYIDNLIIRDNVRAIDRSPDKLPFPQKAEIMLTHTPRFSDLDVNRHINFTKYMEWILDSMPYVYRCENRIIEFEINYLAELIYNETITVETETLDIYTSKFLHCIRRLSDNKEICIAQTTWKSN